MKLARGEVTILVHALAAYRVLATRGELPEPDGGVEAIDAVQYKVEMAVVDVADESYRGIGERKGACFCRTCRTILEGQLRDVLTRLPDDQRRDVIERVEGTLSDGAAP